jgi:4-aminobutyrate aminotransferase / (S)-3-amino-2-methylpropionate transaminase / 5-aminovalerate transaminase
MAGSCFSHAPVDVPHVETQYRAIKTQIPPPGAVEILAQLERYESRSMHGQLPVVWDRAEGVVVSDAWGNRWLDFTSTIFVANTGHANPRVKAALRRAIDGDLLHSYTYPTALRAEYLRRLIEFTPPQFEKAFLLSSGTEATECAVKLMRLHGLDLGKRRGGIISFEGAMHGRTMGAQLLGGSPKARAWIGHDDPNIHRLEVPYPWQVAEGEGAGRFEADLDLLRSRGVDPETDVAGLLIESYIGWGGVFFPIDYVQALRRWSLDHDVLLAFDEIQGGFGRTGTLFAYEHYAVEPDLLCCGKGIASGLPLSAVLGPERVMDLPDTGSMSSTHSANPLVCAAGIATLDELVEHDLINQSARKGALLFAGLHDLQARFPEIAHVLGRGLLAATVFADPETGESATDVANAVCESAMRKGLLLVHTGRESIKLGPPLTIPDDALLEGLEVFGEALADVLR